MQPDLEQYLSALVRLCQRGDTLAFGELYDLLADDLFRYTLAKVDRDEAEDVCAEVFLKAWENIHRYEPRHEVSFRAWFFTIARNVVIDHYRKRREVLPVETIADLEDLSVEAAPERDANRSLEHDYLMRLIRRLKDEYGQAIVLRYLQEMEYGEIASIMGKSETAIRILIHRGLRQLQDMVMRADDAGARPGDEPSRS